jgi:hypothetical protein
LYGQVLVGLENLNATNVQYLLRRSAEILFDDVAPPTDHKKKWELMKRYPDGDQEALPGWCSELEELDEQFCDDPDNLSNLLLDFAEDAGLVEPFRLFQT